jgi:hypothetical protein
VSFDSCVFAACRLQFGYDGLNGYGTLRNNVFTKGLTIGSSRPAAAEPHPVSGKVASWERLRVTGNVIVVPRGQTIRVDLPGPNDAARGWQWDMNTYYSEEPRPFEVTTQHDGFDAIGGLTYRTERLSFAEWKARTGFDANSMFVDVLPAAPIVRVFEVEGLDVDAANVFVYNPARAATVERPEGWRGQEVAVRNVRRYDATIASVGPVFDMRGEPTPPADYVAPAGKPSPVLGTLFPEIGVFRVEKPKAVVDECDALRATLATALDRITRLESALDAALERIAQLVAELNTTEIALKMMQATEAEARKAWRTLATFLGPQR